MPVEEQIRRTRICLFEVGYHDIDIEVFGKLPDGSPLLGTTTPVEPAIGYQVGVLLCLREGRPICCWSCWLDSGNGAAGGAAAQLCRDGDCQHPQGPAKPPRELLLGRA